MDAATALVRLYLHAQAYFAVTDYPIVEAVNEEQYRSVTDVDVLAVRLPGAGRIIPHKGRGRQHDERLDVIDPELAPSEDRIDMIIAEVKEGEAELNRGAREPAVLRGALTRFGKIKPEETEALVGELLRNGEAVSSAGPRVRLMAFGSYRGRSSGRYKVITLKHVLEFLESMFQDHWKPLRHAQFKDPAINFLMVLEKARAGSK
ncbi:MAG: hypothetical protein ACYTGC_06765 [Planctomycetota bacterium]|jgi:hypothetical protein